MKSLLIIIIIIRYHPPPKVHNLHVSFSHMCLVTIDPKITIIFCNILRCKISVNKLWSITPRNVVEKESGKTWIFQWNPRHSGVRDD